MSTLLLVQELTTDDGLQLTGQDLREARSNWVRALLSTGDSFVLELVSERLAITTSWAVIVSLLLTFSPEEMHIKAVLSVPDWPFQLIGGFLSILLVFRTDQSYQRFWEGRSRWSELVGQLRSLTRVVLSSYSGYSVEQRDRVLAHVAAFPVALKQHLRGERNLSELQAIFDTLEGCDRCDSSAQRTTSAHNMPLSLLSSLSRAAAPPPSLSSSEASFLLDRVETAIDALSDTVAECEKLKRTPIPLAYSRNASRVFSLFCLTLPFPLLHNCPPLTVPVLVAGLSRTLPPLLEAAVVAEQHRRAGFAWILYGTEEIGHVIEQPFDVWEQEGVSDPPDLEESEIQDVFCFFDSCQRGNIDKTAFFQAMQMLGVPHRRHRWRQSSTVTTPTAARC